MVIDRAARPLPMSVPFLSQSFLFKKIGKKYCLGKKKREKSIDLRAARRAGG